MNTVPTVIITVLQRRFPEELISQRFGVVLQPKKRKASRLQKIPAVERIPDRQQEWELRDDDGEEKRR